MGNIPDFDPTAYGGESLKVMDLVRLSRAFDATQSVLIEVEAAVRRARQRIDASTLPLPLEVKEEYLAAKRQVHLIRVIAKDVRVTFSARLRQTHEALGLLVGSAVYRASVDMQGIERIELANPPTPTIAPIIQGRD